jgi:hypothetical protein
MVSNRWRRLLPFDLPIGDTNVSYLRLLVHLFSGILWYVDDTKRFAQKAESFKYTVPGTRKMSGV